MSLASWWQIPNLRNTFGGHYLPLPGLFGAIPHPSCTLLGHQWAERVPEEPKSGWDSGLLGGVLSGLSALPHTHQLPHTLLLVSSLIRHQQVPERPCPQRPPGYCGHEGGPHHSCPSTSTAWAPMASSTPQPTGGCPGTAPAAPPFPTSCQVPVMCNAVGASALGKAGARRLKQRTLEPYSHRVWDQGASTSPEPQSGDPGFPSPAPPTTGPCLGGHRTQHGQKDRVS